MVAAGSITVVVRVRPPTAWEAARLPEPCYDTTIRGDGTLATPGKPVTASAPLRDIVQIVDDRILTFDPDEKDKARAFVERGFMPPGTKRYKDKRFMFDKVFDGEARQGEVYAATAMPLLNGLLDGYNATVFAYGATGCGKTHTISGSETDPGVIYLTMADLFQRIEDRRDEWNIEVVVTFLEIYNEEIRDLLTEAGTPTPRGGLQIREDKSVKVIGLVELRPTSAEEVKQIVLQGNSRRTQSPTHANETSSRSHAVLQVHVTQSPRTASLTEQRTVATLSIIDLAGSERAAATSNMGQRMVEGANINKSLLALGNCINALCESGGAIRHVPYRNSKLTRLLKFSLGGNCKTVMVVCVAPTSQHFDDTHNTLLYAERATKIKTKVVTRNVVNVDRHVGRYVEAINRLNLEVAELKSKLAGKIAAENDVARRKRAEANAEVERAKQDMQTRMEQTQASIIDGASCAGQISAAEDKLFTIRARVAQIDGLMTGSSPSPDLEAERALLQALAGPEEQAVKSDSSLITRLTRAQNSRNIFEATLRAASERRSDRLEEFSIENVKADAKWRKAEMDRVRAEAERDAFKESLRSQAELVVTLLGMIGRCTVVLGEASRALKTAIEEGKDGVEGAMKAVATSLSAAAGKNDDTLAALIGQTTATYAARGDGISMNGVANQALQMFTGVASSSALKHIAKSSRRSSYNNIASPRKAYKSPRKSLRSSVGQSYRRVSDKEKKVVQWRDEAGKGDLDDAGQKENPPIISIISSDSSESIGRSHSVAGSESEWEDERTDDSFSLSFVTVPNAGPSSLPCSSRLSSSLRSGTCRRPRPSRLDPGFLKAKGATSLGCLQEAEENVSPTRRASPLSERSMNLYARNDDDASTLHIPKKNERSDSPSHRLPTSTPRHGVSSTKGTRRRSNGGPFRNERTRRRSSMIPQPADELPETGGPRRVEMIGRSPAKRAKRLSLLGNASRSLRVKGPNVLSGLATFTVPGADPNSSISTDSSMKPAHPRPSWR
ncbi:kinesin-domain-containing protein [Imleria badia]|nr:kinesin-domain-containing protein [Imleria badia]